MSKRQSLLALDFFNGGVPAGTIFEGVLDDLRKLNPPNPSEGGIDRLAEISFVGAVSYFEAFCKDHFASAINIYPGLLFHLARAKVDLSIDALKMIEFAGPASQQIGFLVAEKFDFGTASKINQLYFSLFGITPLSKEEMIRFSDYLRDRNLLVHHGGVYTSDYIRQSLGKISGERSTAFMYSKVIRKKELFELFDFLQLIAAKIIAASHAALKTITAKEKVKLRGERKKALEYFSWWGIPDD